MKIITAITIALCVTAAAQETRKPKAQPAAPAVPAAPADPGPATTEPATEPDTPEKTVAKFFASIQRKEVDQAYEALTRGTKIAERAEDVKMLKSKTKDAIQVFGAIGGYDLAATKKVGERLVSYTYVSLGKEFPLRWRFYFYKPADSWKLIDLRVDDRLAAIFDEPDERVRGE
jgi:hypothetical protein